MYSSSKYFQSNNATYSKDSYYTDKQKQFQTSLVIPVQKLKLLKKISFFYLFLSHNSIGSLPHNPGQIWGQTRVALHTGTPMLMLIAKFLELACLSLSARESAPASTIKKLVKQANATSLIQKNISLVF